MLEGQAKLDVAIEALFLTAGEALIREHDACAEARRGRLGARGGECDALHAEETGVVGAGGAGFPTHVKLAGKADTVVINAAECEPLLHKDKEVLRDYADGVLAGTAAAMRLVTARRAGRISGTLMWVARRTMRPVRVGQLATNH